MLSDLESHIAYISHHIPFATLERVIFKPFHHARIPQLRIRHAEFDRLQSLEL
jgi:hypothetical protein